MTCDQFANGKVGLPKRQKLIYTGRNEITGLNRKGIERVAGNSYGVPEKEYRRLIG